MRRIPNPGVLAPGQDFPTHPIRVAPTSIPWYKKDLRELVGIVKIAVWIAIVLAAILLLYLAIGVYGHIAIKYGMGGDTFPVNITGRSMEPTIHQPIRVGSLSFGSIILISRKADRPVDSILLFRTPDGVVEAKRVEKKEDAPGKMARYWFATDNSGMTGEGSGYNQSGYTWIDDINVIGRVSAIWSPRRALRSFTDLGRELNKVEFDHHPREIFARSGLFIVSCSGNVEVVNTGQKRELIGWVAQRWLDKMGPELVLVRPREGKNEYALLNVETWKLATRRNSDGSPLLPNEVAKRFAWGVVEGPLVYAMDDDLTTSWTISPATDGVSTSTVRFRRPTTGTLVLNGGGDAACRVDILCDGRPIAGGQGSWNSLAITFSASRIEIRQNRNESNSSSGISRAVFEGAAFR